MTDDKKYYWLKLKKDFFKRHDIRIIEESPNGKEYILFYLKLLLESIDHEGELRFNETIPYNEQMLSVITHTSVDIVREAMKIFIDFNMMEILDDETIYMSEVLKLTGCESNSAERVRKHREKQKTLQCNTVETKCNTEKEIEIRDKSIDKEYNICPAPQNTKPTRHKYGEYKNVLLSDDELKKLKEEFPEDWESRIERLSEYIASSGKSYKNFLATLRNWAKRDIEKGIKNNGNTTDKRNAQKHSSLPGVLEL